MRILIAYDGSAGAAQAVALAEGIDWPAGSMVRVVSVVEPAPLQLLPWTTGDDASRVLEHDALAYVEADQASVARNVLAAGNASVLVVHRPAEA